jgi:hypothetical protein
MSTPPPPLPVHLRDPLGPDRVFADYIAAIRRHIDDHPRSQQKILGPSEIGDPCERRVVYKMLQVPERPTPPNWKATVGTACHTWAEGAFDADNLRRAPNLEGQERWLIESTLVAGYVPGYGFIGGHSDLYDRVSRSNWDHKFPGPEAMRKYRSANDPGPTYRIQAHTYGLGWENAGHTVTGVAIAFLPRNGELADAFFWSEEYDRQIAIDALGRVTRLWRLVEALGAGTPAVVETADEWCSHCPFLRPGATDVAHGCPGHPGSRVTTPAAPALSFGHTTQPALV